MAKQTKKPRTSRKFRMLTTSESLMREIKILIHSKVRNLGKVYNLPLSAYMTPEKKRRKLNEVKSFMRGFLKRYAGHDAPLPRV